MFAMTLDKARARGLSVHVLPHWFDVDTEADLQRLHADMTAGTPNPQRTYALVRQLYGPMIAARSASLTPGTAAGEGHCP